MIHIRITKLLSLDTSSSASGWAYFENGEYIQSGVINFNTSECKKKYKGRSDKRLDDMCISIINMLSEIKPDIVLVEKLNVGRNMASTRMLAKIMGVIYGYTLLNDCDYEEIQASEWRSKIGIQSAKLKREDYKRLSIQYVKDNIKKDVSDDEADSICAGIGYIKMFD